VLICVNFKSGKLSSRGNKGSKKFRTRGFKTVLTYLAVAAIYTIMIIKHIIYFKLIIIIKIKLIFEFLQSIPYFFFFDFKNVYDLFHNYKIWTSNKDDQILKNVINELTFFSGLNLLTIFFYLVPNQPRKGHWGPSLLSDYARSNQFTKR